MWLCFNVMNDIFDEKVPQTIIVIFFLGLFKDI